MIGIVVPTLGTRPDYLTECLESISNAGKDKCSVHIVVVAPKNFSYTKLINTGMINAYVEDTGRGLAEAINSGFAAMPEEVKYINWLGDDDLLKEDSLYFSSLHLNQNPETVMVFGDCDYIDPEGRTIWTNKSSEFAVPLLRVGPDLIPQPGALFKRESFNEVLGLDGAYKWAFDFDLFIKFSKVGKLRYLNRVLGSFRWHPESLSVEHRKDSVLEASKVRTSHLPKPLRVLSPIWEIPVRFATLIAGSWVTARSKKRDSHR